MGYRRAIGAGFDPRRAPTQVPTWPIALDQAPRALSLCIVPGAPSRFTDLVSGARPVVTGPPSVGISAPGPGLVTNGSGTLGYPYFSAPAAFSMEALVQAGPSVVPGEVICGWNKNADGTNSDHDRTLSADGSTHYVGSVYPGGNTTTTTSAFANNVVSHLVYTSDGTTANIYLNGRLESTGGGSAFTGYVGSYFVVGFSTGQAYWSGRILLVNLANTAWTASEIAQRAAEPFAMFRPIVRRQYYAVAATAPPPTADEMLFHPVF